MISEQGWAAITAYECAGAAAAGARDAMESYALRLMIQHMYRDHGYGVRKIAKDLNIKMALVKKVLGL